MTKAEKAAQKAAKAQGGNNAPVVNNNVEGNTPAAQTEETPAEGEGEGKGNTPAAQPAAPVAQPAAPAIVFKVNSKQPKGNGKKGGRGKTDMSKLFKFAEASYGHVNDYLKHILNGAYVPGFYGMPGVPMPVDAEGKEIAVPTYKTLEEAAAAKAVLFLNNPEVKDHFITYKQNRNLPENSKTSKPSQEYHCYLTATSADDVKKAIAHLTAFEAMPWNAGMKGMVSFLTDEAGNVKLEQLIVPEKLEAISLTAETATTETETATTETELTEA